MLKKKFFLDHSELAAVLARDHKQSRIVFTNGCFDILHVGHVRYLQEAKSLGDILVVGLNTDASVAKLKGPTRPVQHELDRAEIMAALSCTDYVTLFSESTPLKLIELVKPNVLVKGGDWAVEQIVGSDFVLKNGGDVRSLRFQPGHSTSSIIEKIKT